MSDSKSASGGIGLSGALFLLFLGLRLTDHIDWAWYWVAAPLWIPIGLVLTFLLVVGAMMLIGSALDRRARRRAREKRAKEGKPATTKSIDRLMKEYVDGMAARAGEKRDLSEWFGPKGGKS